MVEKNKERSDAGDPASDPDWVNLEWVNPEWVNPEWVNPEWVNPEWVNKERTLSFRPGEEIRSEDLRPVDRRKPLRGNRWLLLWPVVLGYFLVAVAAAEVPADRLFFAATNYWATPIPHQTPPPPDPAACGACHPYKRDAWHGSRHSMALSPGLMGQLLDFSEEEMIFCLSCHAPMADQQTPLLDRITDLLLEDPFLEDPSDSGTGMETLGAGLLARHGVFCGACHVRHDRLQIPLWPVALSEAEEEAGAVAPLSSDVAGGYVNTDVDGPAHPRAQPNPLLVRSLFCRTCHQFDQETAVNGKPIQNTYQEWLASAWPDRGVTCQGCHMPGGQHLFRGIHDPETVRNGVTVSAEAGTDGAVLTLRSTGIGHHFPTYTVPRIRLIGEALDSSGQPIVGGSREIRLQRRVEPGPDGWTEISDTRLESGGSVGLHIPWQVDSADSAGSGKSVCQVRFRILVEPDWFYQQRVYLPLLADLEPGLPRTLIQQASAEASANVFTLWQGEVKGDCFPAADKEPNENSR